MFLDVASALHVHVEDHVLPGLQLVVNLLLQRAVEAVLIDLFVLQELTGCNAATELFGREEEVFHTVLFGASGRTACGADAEGQLQFGMFGHEPLYNGALSAAAGGAEDDAFSVFLHK